MPTNRKWLMEIASQIRWYTLDAIFRSISPKALNAFINVEFWATSDKWYAPYKYTSVTVT